MRRALFLFKSNKGQQDFGSEYNQSRFKQHLKDNDGKEYAIVEKEKGVSDNLRGFMFGAVIPFLRQIDPSAWQTLTNKQVYEVLKKNFNYFEAYDPIKKRVERYAQSVMSKSIKSHKAMDFIERIDNWTRDNYAQSLPDPEAWKEFVRDNPQLIVNE